MYKLIVSTICILQLTHAAAQQPISPYGLELANSNPVYSDVYNYYKAMDAKHKNILMHTAGPTDTKDSLQVIYYTSTGKFDITEWKKSNKVIILINNGIHPGEPDGIVATMQLLWDITQKKVSVPDNVVLAIIPAFNISGATRLRTGTRANQDGPELTGFRGNGQNLDLNRDFMKMDARETSSLIKLFRKLDPDVLIDNHVSNGADYQHIMTLLSTQYGKLGGAMGNYLNTVFEPALYQDMKQRGYDLVPYVNVWGKTPDNGWRAFLETPRFLSGYAALHHCFAFVPETHMLKPYADRVKATYALMQSIIGFSSDNAKRLQDVRQEQREWVANSEEMPINWQIDTSRYATITYKGYKSGMKKSAVSGQQVMYYDKGQPYTAQIPFYNYYVPSTTVKAPKAYVIPQGWHKVIKRLKDNGVAVQEFEADTILNLTVTKIGDFRTTSSPYEGHYLHSNISGTSNPQNITIRNGDYIIPVAQPAKRYIIESLELSAPDGFFAWGFFDGVLQQKEGFSDYAFEDLAADILKNDKTLAALLAGKCATDSTFAKDADAQLEFVFQNCAYHEPEHLRYPVYRLE